MSDPKRYIAKISWTQIETQEHPNGEFVLWQDYARLKAEVERLKSNLLGRDATIMGLDSTIKCREAEVERLRKAGDEMARIIAPPTHGTGEWDGEWDAWHNAKAGVLPRQSPPDTPSTAV